MEISLVTPAYNEEKTLEQISAKVFDTFKKYHFELIIVDDASTDGTREVMKRLKKRYPKNVVTIFKEHSGKSQTVKRGILESKGDYVVIQDADMEYDPKDILVMLKKLKQDDLDVVYGNRFGKNNKVIYIQNWIGNTFLSYVSGIFTGLRAGMFPRDMEVCYKLAKGDMYRELGKDIESKTNFGFEPEISARFSKVANVKFAQVPIKYYPRTIAQGKKMNAVKHGLEALRDILYFNLIR